MATAVAMTMSTTNTLDNNNIFDCDYIIISYTLYSLCRYCRRHAVDLQHEVVYDSHNIKQ